MIRTSLPLQMIHGHPTAFSTQSGELKTLLSSPNPVNKIPTNSSSLLSTPFITVSLLQAKILRRGEPRSHAGLTRIKIKVYRKMRFDDWNSPLRTRDRMIDLLNTFTSYVTASSIEHLQESCNQMYDVWSVAIDPLLTIPSWTCPSIYDLLV